MNMKAPTGKITNIVRITPTLLAAGTYSGQWSGYQIVLNDGNGIIRMSTEIGIRGIADVTVICDELDRITVQHLPITYSGTKQNGGLG